MKKPWNSIFVASLLLCSSQSYANADKLALEDCHIDGIKQKVQCGTLQVPENYQVPAGTQISVNFAVIPAIDKTQNKEPLMFLAGGPGQAAAEIAASLRQGFTQVRKTRDLILVDQRGTGKSNPLQCEEVDDVDPYASIPEDLDVEDIKQCLAQFEGDLSQFNTENAIRDFDAVRAALGYEKIAIYGGSYGTRAGLVFMRMFPDSLSAVVLDSVGPIEVPIGTFGQSSARSFNMLIQHCMEEATCKQAYPNLAQEFATVMERLSEKPITTTITHPRLGTPTEFVISRLKFVSTLRMQLYTVEMRTMVPLVVHQAFLGNFAPLAGLTAMQDSSMGMYVGLLFNIVCNEDVPRISDEMWRKDADNNFGQDASHLAWKTVCPVWPQYRLNETFYQPVTTNVPTLIISGDVDPVTPPSNGEYSDKSLPNSKHLILKNSGHTPGPSTCAINIIDEFLTIKDPNVLDESCLNKIPSESFMTSLNGSI
ncbi:alpha/beta hydrolase [Thalassotalea piscium]|uniref:Pimeloyl-ACP methyl ester carboxylesterase n=1 Tax=Thalassotalea piscium TaxID=1230533 RepID=A0A7X0TS57_9GAMM|nr:alpha/beta hydrolase [Thalassotalea piscium]MBB6541786.1 pimeloyl-ACP methyl ester carboxylesterase [Thalassotalea piscium]